MSKTDSHKSEVWKEIFAENLKELGVRRVRNRLNLRLK